MPSKSMKGPAALRDALLKKTGWSKQRLHQVVQQKHGQLPMSTKVAQAVIAHEKGLRLGRFLDGDDLREAQETVAKLRGFSAASADVPGRPRRGSPARSVSERTIVFPSEFRLKDPLLPTAILNEAREMAQIYPLLYVLENSLREIIRRVMTAQFGDDWWNTAFTSGKSKQLKDKADDRIEKEDVQAWHQRRGAHPIDYVDLDDLRIIAASKPNLFFPDILGEQLWFEQFMRELYPSRCVLCHMNALSDDNVKDVRLKLSKWQKVVAAAMGRLPNPLARSGAA